MCKLGPHIYIRPDYTSTVQLSCFLTADIRVSEVRILKAFSKCSLNDLSRTFGVALIHCLADINDSKEGDKVKVFPNPGETDISTTLRLIICLVLKLCSIFEIIL